MGKYGQAAIFATSLIQTQKANSPLDAWNLAVSNYFPNSKSSQDKSCPKGAYLGLCEAGFVNGVKACSYGRSKQNKDYAFKAVRILDQSKLVSYDELSLWKLVLDGESKVLNGQMDVVLSLWNAGHIKV